MAFYPHQSRAVALPFIVCAQGRTQDRLIFGPSLLAENQTEFMEWLYGNVPDTLQPGASGFRLGEYRGNSIAARFVVVKVKESISARENMTIAVGLFSPARQIAGPLCEALGKVFRPMIARILTGGYAPREGEDVLLREFVSRIVNSESGRDWSDEAEVASDECSWVFTEIRRRRSPASLRERGFFSWLGRKPKIIGAISHHPMRSFSRFKLAASLFRESAEKHLTVLEIPHSGAANETSMFLSVEAVDLQNTVVLGEFRTDLGHLRNLTVLSAAEI